MCRIFKFCQNVTLQGAEKKLWNIHIVWFINGSSLAVHNSTPHSSLFTMLSSTPLYSMGSYPQISTTFLQPCLSTTKPRIPLNGQSQRNLKYPRITARIKWSRRTLPKTNPAGGNTPLNDRMNIAMYYNNFYALRLRQEQTTFVLSAQNKDN